MHDLAFLHDPDRYTWQGVRVMTRSLAVARDHARLVLTSSQASYDDLVAAGVEPERLRIVPLGVSSDPAAEIEIRNVRHRYDLPERFALFVGTLEPRKNLHRLATAAPRATDPMPLVIAGPDGWGDSPRRARTVDVRFLGFVPAEDLPALYAAATVFAYPSEREGFGLPVAEAMAQGTPVVTSVGTSTEEVAGGAAVLVDPLDVGRHRRWPRRRQSPGARTGRRRSGASRRADVGGDGGSDARRLPRGHRTEGRRRDESASTCSGACPGEVGGSEEYLVRQLTGLHDVAPEIHTTLAVLPGFAAAHPEVAAGHELVVGSLDARRRSRRVLAEATWLPSRLADVDVVHHGGGTVPPRSPRPIVLTIHDLQYRTFPEYLDRAQAAVPVVGGASLGASGRRRRRAQRLRALDRRRRLRHRRRTRRGRAPRCRSAVDAGPTRPRSGHVTTSAIGGSSCTRRSPTRTRTTGCLLELLAGPWSDPDLVLVLLGGAGAADADVAAAIRDTGLAARVDPARAGQRRRS